MKLDSQNNMKFPNHAIKRAHNINSEKIYDKIKMRDYMDRPVTSPSFMFYILLNGDVYEKKFFTENFNTLGRLFKRSPTYCASSQTCDF